MRRPLTTPRMIEMSGAEALWLIQGNELGRLVYPQRGRTVVRPARHVWESGHLVVRAPVQTSVVPETVAYQVDEIQASTGIGWTVTLTGRVDVIADPHEAAHHSRTLTGWTHGPHDALVRLRPESVSGFRLLQEE